ncbi:flagellar protein FlgN [Bacillus sp. FJAT-49705]|uniref:Flagellar protein FlgN n=1 Tax=Cytobacillus citreus TaxID=2833586 RepID=A0ABS5NS28_9BACI|nr:flagellar protein FlgN [Cytobacillus citreus]MBS4190253.1 flagellar protein FlgN [Cytobacillus citreus]
MSAEALIASIEKLLKLHRSLYELAIKKTDIIKNGDMEALSQMLNDEQTHITAIEHMEKERQRAAKALAPQNEQPKVSDCTKSLEVNDQDKFARLTDELVHLIFNLKEQNYLNQQLIYQSQQFVNLSMSLLRPQTENINYGPPTKNIKPSDQNAQGMFNSKA